MESTDHQEAMEHHPSSHPQITFLTFLTARDGMCGSLPQTGLYKAHDGHAALYDKLNRSFIDHCSIRPTIPTSMAVSPPDLKFTPGRLCSSSAVRMAVMTRSKYMNTRC